MSYMIISSTSERETRAVHGELPHLVLHASFLYFFGAIPFMYLAIFLSMSKLMSVYGMRWGVYRWIGGDNGCTADAARCLLNDHCKGTPTPAIQNVIDRVGALAIENRWDHILSEFFNQKVETWTMRIQDAGKEFKWMSKKLDSKASWPRCV